MTIKAPIDNPVAPGPAKADTRVNRVSVNLDNVVPYLQLVGIGSLDAVCVALKQKMKALGVGSSRRAHRSVKPSGDGTCDGDIRGVLRFINGATEDDAATLQTLDAVVSTRLSNAGREVEVPDE